MKYYFYPKHDITAFELACIVARLSGGMPPRHGIIISDEQWGAMPAEIKRHWSLEPPKGDGYAS
jgi:hypothetical protein